MFQQIEYFCKLVLTVRMHLVIRLITKAPPMNQQKLNVIERKGRSLVDLV